MCRSNKRLNAKLCANADFWQHRLRSMVPAATIVGVRNEVGHFAGDAQHLWTSMRRFYSTATAMTRAYAAITDNDGIMQFAATIFTSLEQLIERPNHSDYTAVYVLFHSNAFPVRFGLFTRLDCEEFVISRSMRAHRPWFIYAVESYFDHPPASSDLTFMVWARSGNAADMRYFVRFLLGKPVWHRIRDAIMRANPDVVGPPPYRPTTPADAVGAPTIPPPYP
jgi:hypothetical protein